MKSYSIDPNSILKFDQYNSLHQMAQALASQEEIAENWPMFLSMAIHEHYSSAKMRDIFFKENKTLKEKYESRNIY